MGFTHCSLPPQGKKRRTNRHRHFPSMDAGFGGVPYTEVARQMAVAYLDDDVARMRAARLSSEPTPQPTKPLSSSSMNVLEEIDEVPERRPTSVQIACAGIFGDDSVTIRRRRAQEQPFGFGRKRPYHFEGLRRKSRLLRASCTSAAARHHVQCGLPSSYLSSFGESRSTEGVSAGSFSSTDDPYYQQMLTIIC